MPALSAIEKMRSNVGGSSVEEKRKKFKVGDFVIVIAHDNCEGECTLRSLPGHIVRVDVTNFWLNIDFNSCKGPLHMHYSQEQVREATAAEMFVYRVKNG